MYQFKLKLQLSSNLPLFSVFFPIVTNVPQRVISHFPNVVIEKATRVKVNFKMFVRSLKENKSGTFYLPNLLVASFANCMKLLLLVVHHLQLAKGAATIVT